MSPGIAKTAITYPPSQKTMGVSAWMNATVGPFEARRAKKGASADSAEEMKDITGVSQWRLHLKGRNAKGCVLPLLARVPILWLYVEAYPGWDCFGVA
jgi:hypothetical protein